MAHESFFRAFKTDSGMLCKLSACPLAFDPFGDIPCPPRRSVARWCSSSARRKRCVGADNAVRPARTTAPGQSVHLDQVQ